MKKFLAILLAAILLLTSFAVTFAVFADGDEVTEPDPVCEYCHQNHTSTVQGKCTCCFSCKYLDFEKVSRCSKDATHVFPPEQRCCSHCTGWYNCTCSMYEDCNCQYCNNQGNPPPTTMGPVVPEDTQIHIKDIFQNIMKKISEVFDRMFEVAFAIFNIK